MDSNKSAREMLRKDIFIYLGNDTLSVELTKNMVDLAIDMAIENHKKNSSKSIREIAIGHAMIMLGIVRSKFKNYSISGIEINMNGEELIKQGNLMIGRGR